MSNSQKSDYDRRNAVISTFLLNETAVMTSKLRKGYKIGLSLHNRNIPLVFTIHPLKCQTDAAHCQSFVVRLFPSMFHVVQQSDQR